MSEEQAALLRGGKNQPADGTQLKASPLPGYAKAQANCVACLSAEYLRYQPPAPYWDAMVKRMKAVFNAPIDVSPRPPRRAAAAPRGSAG